MGVQNERRLLENRLILKKPLYCADGNQRKLYRRRIANSKVSAAVIR